MIWWRNKLVSLAIGLICFVMTAAGLRAFLPWPQGDQYRTKVHTYLDHRDEYDAIYIGSSFIAHGIDPRIVDRTVSRRLGRGFSSFNLGLNGASGFETDHLIRTMLDDPPERLRFLLIEAPNFSSQLGVWQRFVTDRSIFYHTPRVAWLTLSDIALSPYSIGVRFRSASLRWQMFTRRMTNAGTGPELARTWMTGRSPSFDRELATLYETNGYSPMGPGADGRVTPARQRLLDRPEGYIKYRDRFETRPEFLKSPRGSSEPLEAQVRFLGSRGLTPIYLLPPVFTASGQYENFEREGTIPFFLSYAYPSRHPDLYALESRWDSEHLNRRGARLWSRQLGDALAEIIATVDATR